MDGFESSAEAGALQYRGAFRRALSIGIFPFTMVLFVGAGLFALRSGLRPELLSPLLVGPFLIWIAAFERLHPYCPAWNRDHGDLRNDLVHLVVSGMLTPQAAIWLLNMTLLPLGIWLRDTAPALRGGAGLAARFTWFGWPTQWPILLQLCFALVISELFGYWAHRLQHTVPLFWRVHALHHGAPRLYWLNAVRFHPLDMLMLAGAGFAPLILLGCPPDTMALTLFFASMHGTWQHANIHVKLGVLNWVFSMAELHRWHHSRSMEESNTNYSGHVLIWDIVFGTRFLPADRLPPDDIGIAGMATFPEDYVVQLKSPFILPQLEAEAGPEPVPSVPSPRIP
jgi:sterol desaturase/sphingolipid hydroxylase (fatty acid hydroxylase superfamily)